MTGSVVHVEVRGLDAPSLQAFYQEVFGWERIEDMSIGDYSVAELGTGRLTVGIGPVPEGSLAQRGSSSRLTTSIKRWSELSRQAVRP
jgi:predicted enzyme related to lactoylglutathione lyase